MTPRHKSSTTAGRRATNSASKAKTPLLVGLISCLVLAASVLVAPAALGSLTVDNEEGVDATVVLGDTVVDASVGGAEGLVVKSDNADLHCFGSLVLFFEPGLTTGESPQTITGYMNAGTELSPTTPCSSATGVPYKGVTFSIKGSGELACTANRRILGNMNGTADVIWDNGDESTLEFKALSFGALPVFEYKVTDGELKGSTFYQEYVPTSITGNCDDTAVTSFGGSGVGTIVSDE